MHATFYECICELENINSKRQRKREYVTCVGVELNSLDIFAGRGVILFFFLFICLSAHRYTS